MSAVGKAASPQNIDDLENKKESCRGSGWEKGRKEGGSVEGRNATGYREGWDQDRIAWSFESRVMTQGRGWKAGRKGVHLQCPQPFQ